MQHTPLLLPRPSRPARTLWGPPSGAADSRGTSTTAWHGNQSALSESECSSYRRARACPADTKQRLAGGRLETSRRDTHARTHLFSPLLLASSKNVPMKPVRPSGWSQGLAEARSVPILYFHFRKNIEIVPITDCGASLNDLFCSVGILLGVSNNSVGL